MNTKKTNTKHNLDYVKCFSVNIFQPLRLKF